MKKELLYMSVVLFASCVLADIRVLNHAMLTNGTFSIVMKATTFMPKGSVVQLASTNYIDASLCVDGNPIGVTLHTAMKTSNVVVAMAGRCLVRCRRNPVCGEYATVSGIGSTETATTNMTRLVGIYAESCTNKLGMCILVIK